MVIEEDGESLDKAKGVSNKSQRAPQLQKIPEDLAVSDAEKTTLPNSPDADKKVCILTVNNANKYLQAIFL